MFASRANIFVWITHLHGTTQYPDVFFYNLSCITRNMGQDDDGHAHFDKIWRPNITINYMGVDQNIKF